MQRVLNTNGDVDPDGPFLFGEKPARPSLTSRRMVFLLGPWPYSAFTFFSTAAAPMLGLPSFFFRTSAAYRSVARLDSARSTCFHTEVVRFCDRFGGGSRSVDDVCEVSDDTIDEDEPAMTNFGLLDDFFAGICCRTSICTHGLILSAFENPTARNASGTVAPVHLRRNLTADWTRGSL